ncbi:MAG TPA: SCO family protein [Stellaceae bacterium]
MARKSYAMIGLLVLLGAAVAAAVATGAVLWLERPATGALELGGPFALTDANDGKPVTEQSFRGKLMLIYFGYTFCPDACPTTLNNISDAMAKLGPAANRIAPLFISVDPARDTQKIMASYVKAFDPRIQGLVGDAAAIAQIAKEFAVYYKIHQEPGGDYLIDHSSLIYLMDEQGRFLKVIPATTPGDRLAAQLKQILNQEHGQGHG